MSNYDNRSSKETDKHQMDPSGTSTPQPLRLDTIRQGPSSTILSVEHSRILGLMAGTSFAAPKSQERSHQSDGMHSSQGSMASDNAGWLSGIQQLIGGFPSLEITPGNASQGQRYGAAEVRLKVREVEVKAATTRIASHENDFERMFPQGQVKLKEQSISQRIKYCNQCQEHCRQKIKEAMDLQAKRPYSDITRINTDIERYSDIISKFEKYKDDIEVLQKVPEQYARISEDVQKHEKQLDDLKASVIKFEENNRINPSFDKYMELQSLSKRSMSLDLKIKEMQKQQKEASRCLELLEGYNPFFVQEQKRAFPQKSVERAKDIDMKMEQIEHHKQWFQKNTLKIPRDQQMMKMLLKHIAASSEAATAISQSQEVRGQELDDRIKQYASLRDLYRVCTILNEIKQAPESYNPSFSSMGQLVKLHEQMRDCLGGLHNLVRDFKISRKDFEPFAGKDVDQTWQIADEETMTNKKGYDRYLVAHTARLCEEAKLSMGNSYGQIEKEILKRNENFFRWIDAKSEGSISSKLKLPDEYQKLKEVFRNAKEIFDRITKVRDVFDEETIKQMHQHLMDFVAHMEKFSAARQELRGQWRNLGIKEEWLKEGRTVRERVKNKSDKRKGEGMTREAVKLSWETFYSSTVEKMPKWLWEEQHSGFSLDEMARKGIIKGSMDDYSLITMSTRAPDGTTQPDEDSRPLFVAINVKDGCMLDLNGDRVSDQAWRDTHFPKDTQLLQEQWLKDVRKNLGRENLPEEFFTALHSSDLSAFAWELAADKYKKEQPQDSNSQSKHFHIKEAIACRIAYSGTIEIFEGYDVTEEMKIFNRGEDGFNLALASHYGQRIPFMQNDYPDIIGTGEIDRVGIQRGTHGELYMKFFIEPYSDSKEENSETNTQIEASPLTTIPTGIKSSRQSEFTTEQERSLSDTHRSQRDQDKTVTPKTTEIPPTRSEKLKIAEKDQGGDPVLLNSHLDSIARVWGEDDSRVKELRENFQDLQEVNEDLAKATKGYNDQPKYPEHEISTDATDFLNKHGLKPLMQSYIERLQKGETASEHDKQAQKLLEACTSSSVQGYVKRINEEAQHFYENRDKIDPTQGAENQKLIIKVAVHIECALAYYHNYKDFLSSTKDKIDETAEIYRELSAKIYHKLSKDINRSLDDIKSSSIQREKDLKDKKELFRENINKVNDLVTWIKSLKSSDQENSPDSRIPGELQDTQNTHKILPSFAEGTTEISETQLLQHLQASQDHLDRTREIAKATFEDTKAEIKEAYGALRTIRDKAKADLAKKKEALTEQKNKLEERKNKITSYLQKSYNLDSFLPDVIQNKIKTCITTADSNLQKKFQNMKNFAEIYEQKFREIGINVSYDLTDTTHETDTTMAPQTASQYKEYKDLIKQKKLEINRLKPIGERQVSQLKETIKTDTKHAKRIFDDMIVTCNTVLGHEKQTISLENALYRYDQSLIEQVDSISGEIDKIRKGIDSSDMEPATKEELRQRQQKIIDKERLLELYQNKLKQL